MTNEERLHELFVKRDRAYTKCTQINRKIQAVRRVMGRLLVRRYWTIKELLVGVGIAVAIGGAASWWLISTMPS